MNIRLFIALIFTLTQLLSGCITTNNHNSSLFELNDFSVKFTVKDIQDAIDKSSKSTTLADGLVLVTLKENPIIKIGDPPGKIGISTQLGLKVPGINQQIAKISGYANLVYKDTEKAFYFEFPVVTAVDAPFIPSALEGSAKTVITKYLDTILKESPVYSIPENGSMKEAMARRFLKSVHVGQDEIVALFALK